MRSLFALIGCPVSVAERRPQIHVLAGGDEIGAFKSIQACFDQLQTEQVVVTAMRERALRIREGLSASL